MTSSKCERVVFFVDGFNLYHSICAAAGRFPDVSVKWLDLPGLFRSYLYVLGSAAAISGVHYFTAYAHHLAHSEPGKVARHKAYIRALSATGVWLCESHFKPKDSWDTWTGQRFRTHEEKETDVAMACAVLEGAARGQFDTAVLVTGDTDLRPVVLAFQRLYPGKRLLFAFPFDRKNNELSSIAPGSFTLSAESYARHQLPDRVRLPSGKFVTKPETW
ncbi:MAG: NYN domain-containing protein [Lentisphaerae bacterium]|nr:NYN domain-containing protein [Lentisphaerota bacterium]